MIVEFVRMVFLPEDTAARPLDEQAEIIDPARIGERREQEVEDRVRRAENAELLSARASASLARKRGLVSDLAGELPKAIAACSSKFSGERGVTRVVFEG